MTTANDKVCFFYLRDPRKPERVVTIARKRVGEGVAFEFAVNNPGHYSYNEVTGKKYRPKTFWGFNGGSNNDFDPFCKKTGKMIAKGRLEKHPIVVEKLDGRPMETVAKWLVSNNMHPCSTLEEPKMIPHSVQRIAKAWLEMQEEKTS